MCSFLMNIWTTILSGGSTCVIDELSYGGMNGKTIVSE